MSVADKNTRAFVTPEGVDLRLQIGDGGQRAAAFFIDTVIIMAALVALTLLAVATGITSGGQTGMEIAAIIWLLVAFLLRNFYFTAFELSAAAATPGKRLLGLRVAARDGGRLRAEAVLVRNAMRELEVFMPLSVIMMRAQEGGGQAWMFLAALAWVGIFALFPLFNRDRLRIGDLVGGTWVVRTPRQRLARDMAVEGSERLVRYPFTPQQLDAYGEKELHVLEEVIRRRDRRTVRAVAERISVKIGWAASPDQDDYDFLSAYYAALRGRLEGRMLMGRRRRDKHAA
ncbi:RDD family protein [Phenylobacterium sp. 58.2.17]|uniref:RDD family protein n=1 Tax=Phenylobacterium sp. 58.2.17 TaxID=2969306 RepID=UPI002263C4F1|nr:RDD family protein [Phenylobacterium sp. 58.2.17]MCX7586071.1 RDD family protein [Phenylobacterium sp. 58.2.17]